MTVPGVVVATLVQTEEEEEASATAAAALLPHTNNLKGGRPPRKRLHVTPPRQVCACVCARVRVSLCVRV